VDRTKDLFEHKIPLGFIYTKFFESKMTFLVLGLSVNSLKLKGEVNYSGRTLNIKTLGQYLQ
jgi:hypothetical protein